MENQATEPIIEFLDVKKEYFLYKNEKARFKAIFTKNRGVKKHPALKGVSFKIYPGESVGIIGKNGAGKSTILKMITGVSFPNSGTITVRGKVAALLELTAGFSLDMTGMENIYLKGYLLGLNDDQIKEIEQDIIDFADLGEYIDQPVRTYSSGMFSKLAFSITAILEPKIMLVDEVLSVGDAKFRKKSGAKMQELIKDESRTVILVSHNSDTIRKFCDRVIWLHEGDIKMIGPTDEVMPVYDEFMS